MTRDEALNLLNELWESGEVPKNFNEEHSEYDKAVTYTMNHNNFDYKDFLEKKTIINFGIWHVEENELIGKVTDGYDYRIANFRLWETRDYNDVEVWDWLVHLTEKTWITQDNIGDLNNAFFFCQDYFKKLKPDDLRYISTAQTLFIQKQLMEIKKSMSDSEEIQDDEITVNLADGSMEKYIDLMSQIKHLELPE